jgi:hypothetical protein
MSLRRGPQPGYEVLHTRAGFWCRGPGLTGFVASALRSERVDTDEHHQGSFASAVPINLNRSVRLRNISVGLARL